MPTATWFAVILVILIGAVAFWGFLKFNAELKQHHPSEWERLGKPTLFSMKSMRQEFQWMGFVMLLKYRKLRNPRLSMFGDVLFFCGWANLAIFIVFVFTSPH
jgi:hypothetical protein